MKKFAKFPLLLKKDSHFAENDVQPKFPWCDVNMTENGFLPESYQRHPSSAIYVWDAPDFLLLFVCLSHMRSLGFDPGIPKSGGKFDTTVPCWLIDDLQFGVNFFIKHYCRATWKYREFESLYLLQLSYLIRVDWVGRPHSPTALDIPLHSIHLSILSDFI